MFDEAGAPLFPFYWTPNPRIIKGVDPENLRDYERAVVSLLDSFCILDPSDLLKKKGRSKPLQEYLERMASISATEHAAILLKAR
ncbi:hypothetical protein A2U01_0056024, partial [Trifolium medium]|nr:hypothetical protein [Trifolium medium]